MRYDVVHPILGICIRLCDLQHPKNRLLWEQTCTDDPSYRRPHLPEWSPGVGIEKSEIQKEKERHADRECLCSISRARGPEKQVHSPRVQQDQWQSEVQTVGQVEIEHVSEENHRQQRHS